MNKIILGVIVIFFGFIISTMVVDFRHFNGVWKAKTQQELQTACLDDWYKNMMLETLPAQCRQFYNSGIIIK